MKDIAGLVLEHLREPQGYDGVRSLEAMAAESGIPSDKIIRLNGNENSFGPSPKVSRALADFDQYNRYPDPDQRALRESLGSYLGVDPEHIVVGNGSDELIDLITRLFVGPGDNVIEPTPTFGMYRFSARLVNAEVVSVPRHNDFEIDVNSIGQVVDQNTKVIFIASPNNPTGNLASESQVLALLKLGAIVVVDEAYFEYCGQTSMALLSDHPNLIVLRTFSKWAGLAGLRVGLGVMDPAVSKLMMTIKPPYNLNRAAEVALLASLKDLDLLMGRIEPVIHERERLSSLLKGIPEVTPIPSRTNFMMVRLPEGRGMEIYQALARQGVFVRYYDNEEMKDCLRVSIGMPSESDGFVDALIKVL